MITWSIEDRKELKIPVSTNSEEKSMKGLIIIMILLYFDVFWKLDKAKWIDILLALIL